jgi:hypothetical protein
VIAPADVLGLLLDALADRIAERIGNTREREHYDSRNLPPRTSRRQFAKVCRSGRVAEARRIGRDWECSRAAWESARAQRPAAPTRMVDHRPLDARADELLSRAGLRLVRGAR